MELQRLATSTRHGDGSPVIEKSWQVRSCKQAVTMARGDLNGAPFYGTWRVVRHDGKWAPFTDVACSIDAGVPIEWHRPTMYAE